MEGSVSLVFLIFALPIPTVVFYGKQIYSLALIAQTELTYFKALVLTRCVATSPGFGISYNHKSIDWSGNPCGIFR